MASSFLAQIPVIVGVLNQLRPKTILDVGKGFGKYGFLAHEYVGIDHQRRPDPARTLAQQSCVHIDAVECNRDYLWPHIEQLYRRVFVGRVEDMLSQLPNYDVVLMCDVIEHIEKQGGANVVRHFVKSGAAVVISTPIEFFDQHLFESEDEHHRSHWTPSDMRDLARHVDYQAAEGGWVFLLSARKLDVRGFGCSLVKRLRRVARVLRSELK